MDRFKDFEDDRVKKKGSLVEFMKEFDKGKKRKKRGEKKQKQRPSKE